MTKHDEKAVEAMARELAERFAGGRHSDLEETVTRMILDLQAAAVEAERAALDAVTRERDEYHGLYLAAGLKNVSKKDKETHVLVQAALRIDKAERERDEARALLRKVEVRAALWGE